ncbi:Cilia- and flagella-associated protein 251 [Gaertneriomyces sp. JEL0708]|nr:Cilia- and flagella-associated protein 251 [Gaertneriomyces sp. JEL0708]
MAASSNVLSLSWTFGVNVEIAEAVHYIEHNGQRLTFYAAGHTAILFDWESGQQELLQGHVNLVDVLAVSPSQRFLLTADKGPNSLVTIWDIAAETAENGSNPSSLRPMPIKTLSEPHSGAGIVAAAFTPDSKHLITVGADSPQTVAVWDWTAGTHEPLVSTIIDGDSQRVVRVNPDDATEFMTNGEGSVNFFTWNAVKGIQQYVPVLSSRQEFSICDYQPHLKSLTVDYRDFKHTPASFITSTFLPQTPENTVGQALSTTTEGDVIIWTNRNLNNLSVRMEKGKKAAVKLIRLHNASIRVATIVNGQYLVTGADDGFVRVYDMQLRLVAWFERLRSGPIVAVSPAVNPSANEAGGRNSVPNLVVATRHARVFLINQGDINNANIMMKAGMPSESSTTVILEAQYGPMYALAVHPHLPYFVVGGNNGYLYVWNYEKRSLVATKKFEEPFEAAGGQAAGRQSHTASGELLRTRTLAYSTNGDVLAIGFDNGTVRIVHSTTMVDLQQSTPASHRAGLPGYAVSKAPISRAIFAHDGNYLAVADADCGVGIFSRLQGHEEWVFVGRIKAHYKDIVGLVFIPGQGEDGVPRLLSVSKDRHVAEYDLRHSTVSGGVTTKSIFRIDQVNQPICAILHPPIIPKNSNEPPQYYLLAVNNASKFRVYNAETQICRRTAAAPAHGGQLEHLAVIPRGIPPAIEQEKSQYMVYGAQDKVLGVVKLPLDGNPHKSMGVIAHSGKIAQVVPTVTGSHVLSLGRDDGVVNLWKLTPEALEVQIQLGGDGLEPYLDLLIPRTKSGNSMEDAQRQREEFVREMEDYFYYAQLQSQGENSTRPRRIRDIVALDEIPRIMQAMGYYPSLQEIEDMLNEVRYSGWFDGNAAPLKNDVTLEELIQLYVNHRPVSTYTETDLVNALTQAKRLEPGMLDELTQDDTIPLDHEEMLHRDGLLSLIQQYGETMVSSEFSEAMRQLMPDNEDRTGCIPQYFTPRQFVENILGLVPLPSTSLDASA